MPIHEVDAQTLKQWLDNNEAILIDVREPAEYESERIAGSLLIPLATISRTLLPAHAGYKLVLHCRVGGRSLTACHQLLSEIPTLDIYNLAGGILSWREQGYLVEGGRA